jgi:hypothetical protein
MADYFGTSINESPTIVLEAGKDIEGAQGIALAIKNGKAEKRQPVQMLSAYHCLRMMRK